MSEYTLQVDPMGHHYFRRPDSTTISWVGALDEMNALLARAESAEKMADYWENKAKVKLLTPSIDWQRVRIDAAIAAMQGILAGNLYRELLSDHGWPEQRAAFLAIDYASMLTEELKNEVKE